MTKFLNISTDNTLGGNSPSDVTVSSQKAVKEYVDSQTGTAPAFANITGQPTDNTNLASALNAKYDASNPNGYTSNVGTVTSVNNVSPVNGNVSLSIPTVSDTYSATSSNAMSGKAVASAVSGYVPTSRTVNGKALSSNISLSASDVGALPDSTVIPTVNNATLTIQKNGTTVKTFTANASADVTANITVPTKVSDLTNDSGFISGITSSDVTTALGYTPYNSSNPSGYQANVIETVKVNGTALTPSNKAVDITVPAAQVNSDWNAVSGVAQILNKPSLATVATSGSYNDLSNKPTIPAAQVNSDWNASTGVAQILNKPSLATVATSGSYADLSNKPTIPTVNNATLTITQGGTTKGTFTANASSNVTIALDSGASSDGTTISTNSSSELQAIGLINKNTANGATNPKYDWVGTLQEYQDQTVATSHPDWICYITDDVSGGTSVYTKNQVNNLLSVKANSADVYTKTETDNLLSTKTDSTDVNNAITAMLEGLYPVGSIYIGTTSTCPIASLISGSTWTLVSSDRVLQGSSSSHSAGTTINAGLPNITGTIGNQIEAGSNPSVSGAFYLTTTSGGGEGNGNYRYFGMGIDASRSSSIYGNSTTVQPPAYVVNIWQRTA